MKLKSRLVITTFLVSVFPLLILAISLELYASSTAKAALNARAQNQLIALRSQHKLAVENYFDESGKRLHALAQNPFTAEAAHKMRATYESLAAQNDSQSKLEAVQGYIKRDFAEHFSAKNGGESAPTAAIVQAMDPLAIAMQGLYIAHNAHALGEKDQLMQANDRSEYSALHNQIHPYFRDYLKTFGLYDLFLINPSDGRVFYSVYKELDYGTSLLTGPFKDSGLARVFLAARNGKQAGQVYWEDMADYLPSYNAPAAFIASPVIRDGELIAILVNQLPIDKINQLMTFDGRWTDLGLGVTGETYLVGTDSTLRNESRLFIENRQQYLAEMKTNKSQPYSAQIIKRETGIGLQKIDSPASEAALEGKTGFQIINNHSGVSVLSAYAPVRIGPFTWGLMSEMDVSEAHADAETLGEALSWRAAIVTLIAAAVAVISAFAMALLITKPIDNVVASLAEVAAGDGDLTKRLPEANRTDEIGDLARAFNRFTEFMHNLVVDLKMSTNCLEQSTVSLDALVAKTQNSLGEQKANAQMVSAAVTQLSTSVQDVADNIRRASDESNLANKETLASSTLSREASDLIEQMAHSAEKSFESMEHLRKEVTSIESVLTVINGIAEQTNLLALNAAIEAARAGDTGRGFAVVADEVRALAGKTQSATVEIQVKIADFRQVTQTTAKQIQATRERANSSAEQINLASTRLSAVAEITRGIAQINETTAETARQQALAVEEVDINVVRIDRLSDENYSTIEEVSRSAGDLFRLTNSLAKLVGKFKV
jgi:methyl-accepting chemotaxis protein